MILSLFIASNSRNICLEKHWRNVINKSVCDNFFDYESNSNNESHPVIKTAHYYLINIHRDNLYYIAVCSNDVSPLFIIELLHRFVDVLISYFGSSTESVIKDNIVRIYEILDEMIDNGFPLVTEINVLEELVRPPNFLRMLTDTVTGNCNNSMGVSLPSGQLSSVPWRRSGVKYNRNEAYFDVIEEISASTDRAGIVTHCEVDGYVNCYVKLSGMPDLTMTFANPGIIDDVSLHPCVRYLRWMKERVISFIPPDGKFRLMTYHTSPPSNYVMPLIVKGSIQWQENGSRLDITVSTKKLMGKGISNVSVQVQMPDCVTNVTGNPTTGRSSFNSSTRTLMWHVTEANSQGNMGIAMDSNRSVSLRAHIILAATESLPTSCSPQMELTFTVHQYSFSGLKVTRMDMHSENYKPFKGVKYLTKAGNFQVAM